MPHEMILLIVVIIAGFYMAWNIGANDVANAMGTSVGSGALTLKQAVAVAAVLEFSGAFFFGSHVSETIQTGIVDSAFFKDPMTLVYGMLAARLASGAWLQIASYYGWPVSTTHSIVGAIVGFGAVVGGVEAVYWDNAAFIATSWILSPICGGVAAYLLFNFLRRKILFNPTPVAAAKRVTPPLVFCVIGVLTLSTVYGSLSHGGYTFSLFESIAITLIIGALGFIISKLLLRHISQPEYKNQSIHESNPGILAQLEKAKKYLLQAQSTSEGNIQYQTSEILGEIQLLSNSLTHHEDSSKESTEYAIVEKIFGYLQIRSACLMAFAHGANDVANAIGPLAAAVGVLTTGTIAAHSTVPTWTLALGGVGIVVGLATWGWRVIETIGKKITELTPTRGFSAEFGAALTILVASRLGLPISTTHTLVGAVIGVGMARGLEALDLRTVRHIVASWVVTVPAGAVITILFYYLIQATFG
jgi:phosphate/sulfate permease